MLKSQNSIASLISYRLVLVFIVMMVVEVAMTYALTLNHINEAYDFWLEASLRRVRNKLIVGLKSQKDPNALSELSVTRWDPQDSFYYRVTSERKGTLYGDPSLPEPDWSNLTPGEPYFREINMGNHRIREISMMEAIPELGSEVLISVGETLNKRKARVSSIFLYAVIPQLFLSLIALLVLRRLLVHILKPFSTYVELIRNRSPQNLTPIRPGPAVKEINTLIEATNFLLKRIALASDSQKRFIANAAHQIRTPLAGIRLHLDRALRGEDLSEIQRSLSFVSRSERKLIELVNKLLILSEAEGVSLDGLKTEVLDLQTIVRNVVGRLSVNAREKGMVIQVQDQPNNQANLLEGNPVLMEEVMFNLVANAIQHGTPNGHIAIEVKDTESAKVIYVDDDGHPIPESLRPRLFERFSRSTESQNSGSGLGLAIVKEIVELHHGTVAYKTLNHHRCVNRFEIRIPKSTESRTD